MVKFKYFKTLAVYNNNASTIANDDIVFIEDDNSLVTHGKTYKFVEPEYEYVDLGLPSGTLWAKYNVGATSETEYGLYFQWGDIQGYTADQVGSGSGKKTFNWSNYKYCNGSSSGMTKYNSTDGKTVLEASDDAAVANWGGSWRMPTIDEFQELGNATTSAWTSSYEGSGVAGLVLTSKADSSKKLFFPATGHCSDTSRSWDGEMGKYLSSSLHNNPISSFRGLRFSSNGNTNYNFGDNRCYGCPVRAVKDGKNYVEGTGTNGYIAKWTGTNSIGNLIALSASISTQTQSTKFLREDGTWAAPSYTANDGNTQYYLSLNGSTNGTSGTTNLGTIYAPTTAGTSGQYLVSNGSGAPSWGAAPSTATPVVVSSVAAGSAVSVTVDPNKSYSLPLVSSLYIMLGALVDSSSYVNEYHFEFNSGSTATSLSLPSTVKGIDATSIEANKHYEVSIKYDPKDTNYYGIIYSWALS